MTPAAFVAKWKAADLKERAACQEHFLDLCHVLGEKTPAEADPTGDWYTFEKGVRKDTGGQGFADVWKKGFFGWEYKGKRKDLAAAYDQLNRYREALANPPLLVVCDLNRFEVHTNFPGTVKKVHAFDLDGLTDPKNLEVLRLTFAEPAKLNPEKTQEQLTREIADRFARLSDGLAKRKVPPDRAAHFLMKLMFCMFAEDVELLPERLFRRTLEHTKFDPAATARKLADLFRCMASGGSFGLDDILHFNGSLFADADVIELTGSELRDLLAIAGYDWSYIEPSIFGTLFERLLDVTGKRGQLGAHYTGVEDILTLVRPVVVAPLRREWDAVRVEADKLWAKAAKAKVGSAARRKFEATVNDFLYRLAHVTVLDPACGSGNFLYVALKELLDLEKEVLQYRAERDMRQQTPSVRPTQLRGIEVNPWARELAQVVIWIGFLQWRRLNGYGEPDTPVLSTMDTIECRDAVLDLTDPANPKEPDWPDAEFVVGNPPFLGSRRMRIELGDSYVNLLQEKYRNRVANGADICCYWFAKALDAFVMNPNLRIGLLATQSIRNGASRKVLDRAVEKSTIFFARSDQAWVLDGADVRISMVGMGKCDSKLELDGKPVTKINADLTSEADCTTAKRLDSNLGIAFQGTISSGPFEVTIDQAVAWLDSPNPHGRPNSDVLRPWLNGSDIVRRESHYWITDFGIGMPFEQAAYYELPFRHMSEMVKPQRDQTKYAPSSTFPFWQLWNPRQEMRAALKDTPVYIVTPRVAKHRLFRFCDQVYIPDARLVAIAQADNYMFGILHSVFHQCWSLATSSRHGIGNDPTYNLTTCFETFPFPTPTAAQRDAVAAAAKELDRLRSNWLNPPEWTRTETLEFPGSADGPWRRYVHDPNPAGVGTVKYPRLVPKDATAAGHLKKRTLTNLYNERPAWLANAHRRLDEAVAAAYGWPTDLTDDALLARLLALNLERAARSP